MPPTLTLIWVQTHTDPHAQKLTLVHKQQPREQWGVTKPFICMYIMYTGRNAETKRTNMLTCMHAYTHTHTVAHRGTHTHTKSNTLRHALWSTSVDQNSFLSAFSPPNQYPRRSTDSRKCAKEALLPSHPPHMRTRAHTHAQTHSWLLMCDGLCCFLINSSHADWSIHLITGCIDNLAPYWEALTQVGLGQTGQGWIERQRGTVKRPI